MFGSLPTSSPVTADGVLPAPSIFHQRCIFREMSTSHLRLSSCPSWARWCSPHTLCSPAGPGPSPASPLPSPTPSHTDLPEPRGQFASHESKGECCQRRPWGRGRPGLSISGPRAMGHISSHWGRGCQAPCHPLPSSLLLPLVMLVLLNRHVEREGLEASRTWPRNCMATGVQGPGSTAPWRWLSPARVCPNPAAELWGLG